MLLNNISFTVKKKGEYLGIVGLSGSGKSTLLSLLSGHIALQKATFILMVMILVAMILQ